MPPPPPGPSLKSPSGSTRAAIMAKDATCTPLTITAATDKRSSSRGNNNKNGEQVEKEIECEKKREEKEIANENEREAAKEKGRERQSEREKEREDEANVWISSAVPVSGKRRRDENSGESHDPALQSQGSTRPLSSPNSKSHTMSVDKGRNDDDERGGISGQRQDKQQQHQKKQEQKQQQKKRRQQEVDDDEGDLEDDNIDISKLLIAPDPHGWIKVYRGSLRKRIVEEKRKLLLSRPDTLRVDQELTLIQAEVIERPVVTRQGNRSSSSTSTSSSSSSTSSSSVPNVRDVRKFRKNYVRISSLEDKVSLINGEKVLPKETEREKTVRQAHEQEWKEAERLEMIWKDLPNERIQNSKTNKRQKNLND
jgi:hypothetical protein